MKLSKQQRAKRNATRKNNKLKRKYPLFQEQLAELGWLTTPETEYQRICQAEQRAKKHFARLQQVEQEMYQEGILRKNALQAILGAEKIAELEQMFNAIYPCPTGAYYADFWWQQMKRFAPSELKARYCPNKHFHNWEMYDQCPTCGVQINIKKEVQLNLLTE